MTAPNANPPSFISRIDMAGRLFSCLDANLDPACLIHPKISYRVDDPIKKERFLRAGAHHDKHEALIEYIELMTLAPDTPPKPEVLDKLSRVQHGQTKVHICGMKGCGRQFDTAEHLRTHIRGSAHFEHKFFPCGKGCCTQRFHHAHDRVKHWKRAHPGINASANNTSTRLSTQPTGKSKRGKKAETSAQNHEHATVLDTSARFVAQNRRRVSNAGNGVPLHHQVIPALPQQQFTPAPAASGSSGNGFNPNYSHHGYGDQPSYCGPERTDRNGHRQQPYSIPIASTSRVLATHAPRQRTDAVSYPAVPVVSNLANLSSSNAIYPNPLTNPSPHPFGMLPLQNSAQAQDWASVQNYTTSNYSTALPFYSSPPAPLHDVRPSTNASPHLSSGAHLQDSVTPLQVQDWASAPSRTPVNPNASLPLYPSPPGPSRGIYPFADSSSHLFSGTHLQDSATVLQAQGWPDAPRHTTTNYNTPLPIQTSPPGPSHGVFNSNTANNLPLRTNDSQVQEPALDNATIDLTIDALLNALFQDQTHSSDTNTF